MIMDVQCIRLTNQSKIIQDYRDRKESILYQFQYDPYQLKSFQQRYNYLKTQTYKRDELVSLLIKQNNRWGHDESVLQNIERLKDPNSVVVIGGQQAGLLTGPLYTIHKIVSIIIQAREQEQYLKAPVIPVFWIAGEDHDFEEINHVYTYEDHQLKKNRLNEMEIKKEPVSQKKLDKNLIERWFKNVFSTYQETEWTNELYSSVNDALRKSETYVDFFARLIRQLFKNEGLVLIDSNDADLRRFEVEYFLQLIHHRDHLAKAVVNEFDEQLKRGYEIDLDVSTNDAHLFYHLKGERLLLVKNNDVWTSKDGEVSFTKEQIVEKIKSEPENFSNNVVSRPIMQEFIFPVLSFIAGPGEVAYWSVLKGAFSAVNLQLPIVTPRMSITLLKHDHKKRLEQLNLSLESVISTGCRYNKLKWLKKQTRQPIDEMIDGIKGEFQKIHEPLQELAATIRDDVHALTKTNLKVIEQQLDFVGKRLNKAVEEKHSRTLSYYDEIDCFYYPKDGLQERIWNIYYFMNEYGLDLPQKLLEVPPNWEQDHIVVTI